jgi:pyruvate kinase
MNKAEAKALLIKMRELRRQVQEDGEALYQGWKDEITRPSFHFSARNLADYMALRRYDLRELQWELIPAGLSSLGRLEARVMPTIDSVVCSCAGIAGEPEGDVCVHKEGFNQGEMLLEENTERVFGPEPSDRYTRIMVTLPSEAGTDPSIADGLVARGMEVARINCSHDDELIWDAMIRHVREAAERHGRNCRISMEIPGPKIRVDRVLSKLPRARVKAGDRVYLTGEKLMFLPPGISVAIRCSIPEIVDYLKEGESVLIDDGHIETTVDERLDTGVILTIQRVVKEQGVLIRPEKGINFPGIDYKIPLLSTRDLEILDYICKNADIVGCSFVRDTEDVAMLLQEINKRLSVPNSMPVIIKIETLESMRILPEILVAAAGHVPTAVMIARGDLAVEVGYARLSEYQEEILWICESAHVPVIWATQVVENLVKTGIPTRAEISDVTLAAKSECIMLNKGEHITTAVEFVSDILSKFEHHVYKKTSILRRMSIASELFDRMENRA